MRVGTETPATILYHQDSGRIRGKEHGDCATGRITVTAFAIQHDGAWNYLLYANVTTDLYDAYLPEYLDPDGEPVQHRWERMAGVASEATAQRVAMRRFDQLRARLTMFLQTLQAVLPSDMPEREDVERAEVTAQLAVATAGREGAA